MDTQERIVEIIRKVSGKNVSPDPEESLFKSGFLDSFALPDMVAELEQQFSVQVPDSDLNPQTFESVLRIKAYLERR